jgi:hypothetical protein
MRRSRTEFVAFAEKRKVYNQAKSRYNGSLRLLGEPFSFGDLNVIFPEA